MVLDAGASVARLKEAIAFNLEQESPLEYRFLGCDSGRLRLTIGTGDALVVPNLRQTLTEQQRRQGVQVTVARDGVQDDVNDASDPRIAEVYRILSLARAAHNPEQSAACTSEGAEIMLLLRGLLDGAQVTTRGTSDHQQAFLDDFVRDVGENAERLSLPDLLQYLQDEYG